MKRKLSIATLIAVVSVLSLVVFFGCGSDDNFPLYKFPETSEPLKEGAYFMTDLGYAALKLKYAKYDFPDVEFDAVIKDNKIRVDHIFVTNISGDQIYNDEWVWYKTRVYEICENDGQYFGADKYGNLTVKIAQNGDVLHIDDDENIYQFKLDRKYILSEDHIESEDPKDLRVECDDRISVRWSPRRYAGYGAYAVLMSADDGKLVSKQIDFPYRNSFVFSYSPDKLSTGKYILKVGYLGGPALDRSAKEVLTINDSPGLEFEINVTDDGFTMYPGYFFPEIGTYLYEAVYHITDNGYETYIRNRGDAPNRNELYVYTDHYTVLMGDTQIVYSMESTDKKIYCCYDWGTRTPSGIRIARKTFGHGDDYLYVEYSDIVLEFKRDKDFKEESVSYLDEPDIIQIVVDTDDPYIRIAWSELIPHKYIGVLCFFERYDSSRLFVNKYLSLDNGAFELYIDKNDLLPGDNLLFLEEIGLYAVDNENKTYKWICYSSGIGFIISVSDDGTITVRRR